MTEKPASYSEKKETRGRKSLPPDKRKPPQTTVKINDAILPFVKELKSNLKNKTLTPAILQNLFGVLHSKAELQTSLYKNPDTVAIVEELQGKVALLEGKLRVSNKNQSNTMSSGAIDLIEKVKYLESENTRLTINANEEHLRAVKLQSATESLQSKLIPIKKDLTQYKSANLDLVKQRDAEHLKAIKFESLVNKLSGDKVTMRAEIEAMKHKEHDCQALTKSGDRCKKPAKLKTKWHGVEINVCLQHSKKR